MNIFKENFVKRVLFTMMATVALTFSLALAADSPDKKVSADSTLKPVEKKDTANPAPSPQAAKKDEKPDDKKAPPARKITARRRPAALPQEELPVPDEKMTINKVMQLLKGNRDFSGKNLSGLYLVGLDLGRCNFSGANLSKAVLERADFRESNLERADLSGANLRMADFRTSGLRGARLNGATLDGAIWQDGYICAKGSTGTCKEPSP